jgi:hypothetical protein
MAGHPELSVPANRSELRRQCDIMRAHHAAMHEQDKVIASVLRRSKALHNIIGRTGAYRVSRQYSHAAGLNTELARAYQRASDLYEDLRTKKQAAAADFKDD